MTGGAMGGRARGLVKLMPPRYAPVDDKSKRAAPPSLCNRPWIQSTAFRPDTAPCNRASCDGGARSSATQRAGPIRDHHDSSNRPLTAALCQCSDPGCLTACAACHAGPIAGGRSPVSPPSLSPLGRPHARSRSVDVVWRLDPLVEIVPNWRDPKSGLTVRQLATRLKKAKVVRKPVDRSRQRH